MRRHPMPHHPLSKLRLGTALVAVACVFGATPASANVWPAAPSASPDTSPVIDGVVGSNGWYRGNGPGLDYVYLHWNYTDPNNLVDHTVGCEPVYRVDGPTTATGTSITCTAYLKPYPGGGSVSWTQVLKIDADAPTGVTAALSRGADFNGWFNHPVAVSWGGSDAASGIAGCSTATYSGPDKGSAPVSGGCTDIAGNFAAAPVSINYDATAPVLSKAAVDSRNGSDVVTWKSSSPSDTAVVQRWQRGTKNQPVVFRGAGASFQDKKVAAGLEYMYAVQTFDQAGNASKRRLVAGLAKVVTMRKLPYVPRVADQPILHWAAVKGADYYNVQLYRGSKRVYAAWPTTNHLGLPAKWRWNGKRHRLSPGKYRWYVWAGFGARSFARYRTVGSAQFVVPR
jgi:hypothetical protein